MCFSGPRERAPCAIPPSKTGTVMMVVIMFKDYTYVLTWMCNLNCPHLAVLHQCVNVFT